MDSFTITPPNTCALVFNGDTVTYVYAPGKEVSPGAGVTGYELFETPDQALARAKEIDPDYNSNIILGDLTLLVQDYTPSPVEVVPGDTTTLECSFTCYNDPTATVSYQWLDPKSEAIPGATTSTLTLEKLSDESYGTYVCNVSASNAKGQTGSASGSFKVTVYPAITPGATELA